jgi:hypothetical protein
VKFWRRIAALAVLTVLLIGIARLIAFRSKSVSPQGKPAIVTNPMGYCIVNQSGRTLVYHKSGPSGDIKPGDC